ncbi:hypothetical protein BGY98DRAFT_989574 [Russula aff. rugulosa BPL654]|nr:hypothetical protein BGY98DRAFT_989574 [Russula aff. rugulosa BPL654]
MQSQLNRQDGSRNGGFSHSIYPPRAPDSMTPYFTQNATQYNNVQSSESTQQFSTCPTTGPGIGQRNDALPIHHTYGRDLTPDQLNYSMAGPWEGPAQRPSHSGYTMPIVRYDNLEQGGPSYAQPGYNFVANQPHGQTSFSPLLSGAHAAPDDQGPFAVCFQKDPVCVNPFPDRFHR